MKLALASDHRGYEAKRRLLPTLKKLGHEVEDFGCESGASCDYPDFAVPAARAVVAGKADIAILLDGSGIGMSLAANKICGVRAALAHDEITARLAREHNHCNVLCLGSDLLSEDHLRQIVEIFLTTPFSGGRHDRRVEKVCQIEVEEAARHAKPSKAPMVERRKVGAELEKQTFDLAVVRDAQFLDSDFLDRFRSSSSHAGIQPFLRGLVPRNKRSK